VRVVITHDFYETFGGAERVTAEIAATFPDAPVYAILGRRSVARRMGIENRVHRLLPEYEPLLRHYRMLAPCYPPLVRAARLPEADLLIASTYAYAHAFRTPNRAPILCYCHGPFRHLWSQQEQYASQLPGGAAGRLAFRAYGAGARVFDRIAAASVTQFVTQSWFTVELIRRIYGRTSEILAPPIDCELFRPSGMPPRGYFLFVGRLVEAYKRPSIVVEAFARMPDKLLLIAGDGPARAELEARATDNVRFLGALRDQELVGVMQNCDAALFPSVDDFGLVPLEVNACGRPVLAYRGGGALQTVRPGVSGDFIERQNVDAVVAAISAFNSDWYETDAIRAHAMQWSASDFRDRLREYAERTSSNGAGPGASVTSSRSRRSRRRHRGAA
jgi:glycosyltransferase involved in cell wall biosynthesis